MSKLGGSATAYGILYQTLGSLEWAISAHLLASGDLSRDGQALLVLEPAGGGGDTRLETTEGRWAIQWKARSAGSWSLSEVISDVVPDLYRAMSSATPRPADRFIFVTEGSRGRNDQWEPVELFLQQLRSEERRGICALDDTEIILSIGDDELTQQGLFLWITRSIRSQKASLPEAEAETYLKLQHLLPRLEFHWERTKDKVEAELNRFLFDHLFDHGQVQKARHDLLGVALDLAGQGDVRIEPRNLLHLTGLDKGSFRDWPGLRDALRSRLRSSMVESGYVQDQDVRSAPVWDLARPILVLAGDSGQGKTWQLAALAAAAAEGPGIAVMLRSDQAADNDLAAAAKLICEWGLGRDDAKSFERLVEWRRSAAPGAPQPWLSVLIDDVQSPEKGARPLIRKPWEAWGARLAFTTSGAVGRALAHEFPDRVHLVEVQDFDDDELESLLLRRGREWGAVPADLRPTLRRPLLADLYCRIAASTGWEPQHEYELYEQFWRRLIVAKDQSLRALDEGRMRELAALVLTPNAAYPWTWAEFKVVAVDDAAIARLIEVGWLRRLDDGRFEVWHDRLLNWAVAESLAHSPLWQRAGSSDLAPRLAELFDVTRTYAGRSLGYVPMDVLWLLTERRPAVPGVAAIVASLESVGDYRSAQHLYEGLLPTLGRRALPVLIDRLRVPAPADSLRKHWIANGAIQIIRREPDAAADVTSLTKDPDSLVQALAERVLELAPDPEALDLLWLRQSEALLAFERQRDAELLAIRERRFRALRACVQGRPEWIATQVEANDNPTLLRELARLMCTLDRGKGRPVWLRTKVRLMELLCDAPACTLAQAIGHFGDLFEVPRLEAWLLGSERCASAALTSLVTVDPDRALALLPRVPRVTLQPERSAWLAHLYLVRPAETRLVLHRLLQDAGAEFWDIVSVFSEQEDFADAEMADVVMRRLETVVAAAPEASEPSAELRRALHLVARLTSVEVIDRMASYAGSELETGLAKIARNWITDHANPQLEDAQKVLLRLNGPGLGRVAAAELGHSHRLRRLSGIRHATAAGGPEAMASLRAIVTRSGPLLDGAERNEVHEAVLALAALGDNEAVVSSVLKWGFDVWEEVGSFRDDYPPMNDLEVEPALNQLQVGSDSERAHAVLAIGASGRADLAALIREAWQKESPEKEVSLASIVALEQLRDRSDHSITLLARHLGSKHYRSQACEFLLQFDSPEAWRLLENELRQSDPPLTWTDLAIAFYLSKRPDAARVAAEAVWAHFQKSNHGFEPSDVLECLVHLGDKRARTFLKDQAYARELPNFSITGRKAAAINALRQLDSEAAFRAAAVGLRHGLHDRDRMPQRLVDANPLRAIPLLIRHLATEAKSLVRYHIAWTLRRSSHRRVVEESLIPLLDSPSSRVRAVAIEAVEQQRPGFLEDRLRELALDDPSCEVRDSALFAFSRQRMERRAEELLMALRTANGMRRFALLDGYLRLVDPRFMADSQDPLWLWREPIPEPLGRIARAHREKEMRDLRSAAEARDRRDPPIELEQRH